MFEREITDHRAEKTSGTIDSLITIEAGPRGDGGAPHDYRIAPNETSPTLIHFQEGGQEEVGTNGVSNESLLVVVIDRIQSFQLGRYPCDENLNALTHLRHALHFLHDRTRDRVSRGVEGEQRS